MELHELTQLIDEQYYSIGIRSGHEAMANLLDDLISRRLDQTLIDYGFDPNASTYSKVLWTVSSMWLSQGKMWQSVEEHYKWSRSLR